MTPDPKPTIYRNELLQALSRSDRALIEPHLGHVELELRQGLEKPHKPIKNVFFLESGIASVVARANGGAKIEAGIIGREGVTGLMVIMGNDRSPHETYMQVAGEGQRIASDDLRSAMRESDTLQRRLLHYAQAFLIQSSYTSLANGRATLETRLARWLLMAHDRIDGDEIPLVHDFLALMLGVRRAGVTTAIQELEHQGLIDGRRGRIIMADRAGLEEVAKGIYGQPETEYKRLMDSLR